MSNSPLVNFTKISPNKNSPRNHKIDTITIHCVAGNASVESLGNMFAASSRKASSNYGVGTDGRIGMYCEEKDRSWCTSSASNDNRAITIEVANDGGEPDWHSSDKAVNALVELVADICKRNGIPKLLWKADKSLIGKVDQQNMTVHRWFAAKSCPGDYLFNKHGEIADRVNVILSGKTTAPTSTNPKLISDDEFGWNYLTKMGFSEEARAGILGNLYAESGLKSTNMQDSYEKGLGVNDSEYTKAVDDGSYKNFISDKVGYGIAQWTFHTRKQALLNFARQTKRSIGDREMQYEFLCNELGSKEWSGLLSRINSAKTIKEVSDLMLTEFEKPSDTSDAVKEKRASMGEEIYKRFVGQTATRPSDIPKPAVPQTFKEYTILINPTALNVRKGPGQSYPVVTTLRNDKNVYTIVDEKDGWGKLKSGLGWVFLSYTTRR